MAYLTRFAVILFVGLALGTGALGSGQALAAPSASIVMDMRNGEVLHAQSADRQLHPASLTKMMTLYLTFDAIRRGKLRLDQKLTVSRHAARQPASKLYLKAGQRVTVRSLIRATAIKSANDAAMVLAEGIGGSQRGFAQMMTRQAKRLGMKNTRFKNPHGLTQRGHYSTARDMAILGRHLFHDYPQYYNIFQRKTDYAAGKRIWSTNRLLSSYPGADGIKTGYTRAAGYNLVASAHRGNKRILAVVFGGRTSKARNAKVARLLDLGFSRAPRSARTVKPATVVAARAGGRVRVKESPLPPSRPTMRETVMAAVTEVLSSPAAAATSPAASTPRRAESSVAPKTAEKPRPRRKARRRIPPRNAANVPMPPPKPVRVASR